MSASEHDLPPRVTPPGYDQLDAWLRSQCGYGLGSLGIDYAFILATKPLAVAQAALAAYLALAPKDGTDPFLFAHDGGLWAVSQVGGGRKLGPDYFHAAAARKAGPSKDAAFVLARALATGEDWTGTQAVADDPVYREAELVKRRRVAQDRVINSVFPSVADDLVQYASITQQPDLKYCGRDYLGRRADLASWLAGQREQSA